MGISRLEAAEALGLPAVASDNGIRHAYVLLALASHPRAGGDALAFRKVGSPDPPHSVSLCTDAPQPSQHALRHAAS